MPDWEMAAKMYSAPSGYHAGKYVPHRANGEHAGVALSDARGFETAYRVLRLLADLLAVVVERHDAACP